MHCAVFHSITEAASVSQLLEANAQPSLNTPEANYDEFLLETKSEEHLSTFSTNARTMNYYYQHSDILCESKMPFIVCKTVGLQHLDTPNPGYLHVAATSCELILCARNHNSAHAPYTAYYACVPAHLVLENKDCEELLSHNLSDLSVAMKKREVDGRASHTKYYMKSPETNKCLSLRSAPIMWSYQYCKSDIEKEQGPTSSVFMNDLALLEIEPRELLTENNNIISLNEIKFAMQYQLDGAKLVESFFIKDLQSLQAAMSTKVRVKVRGKMGYMVPHKCAHETDQALQATKKDPQLLHHISFVLEER